MLFERGTKRGDELPFDRCCIEAVGVDVLRRTRKFCPLQNAEGAPLDLCEWNRVGNAVVEEQVQDFEPRPRIQLLNLLVFQNPEPVTVPSTINRAYFSGVTTPTRLCKVATLTPKRPATSFT